MSIKLAKKWRRQTILWIFFLLCANVAFAEAWCLGCNPASKHGIDVCFATDFNNTYEYFYRGSSSGVDPAAVAARGCAMFSASAARSNAYYNLTIQKCAARFPSNEAFGGMWGTYNTDVDYTATNKHDGSFAMNVSTYLSFPTCQCNDSRNPEMVALGGDGCYCKYGWFWDDTIRACVPTPPQPVLIALIGLSSTKALPAGPALPHTALVSQNGTPLGGKSVSISVQSAGGTSALSGLTDGSGNFQLTYIPPGGRATQDTITATCTDCSNTASKGIDVTAVAESCPREPGSLFGNPINPASGSKRETAQDYTGNGPHPLSLTRHYTSNASSGAALVAGLGGSWSHSWASALSASTLSAVVTLGDGTSAAFSRTAIDQPWLPVSGTDALASTASGWFYSRSSDESSYLFSSTAGAAPRLVSITQRNGWVASLAYTVVNGANRLASVTNAFGRVMAFSYNSAGQLVSVTPPDGQPISYTYDTAGRLASVGFTNQTTHSYHYEDSRFPQALTGVTREDGARYSTFSYNAYGLAVGTSHAGSADSYTVTEPGVTTAPSSRLVAGNAVDPAIYRSTAQVTDPLGNQQTWVYQGGDGQVRVLGASQAFEGGRVANRSFGQSFSLPTSETDFLGVETMYTWDLNRQLKTATTQAAGRPEAQTSSTEWHPTFRLPVLVTEAGRTTASTYDSRGNLLTQSITDTATNQVRTWAWSYFSSASSLNLVETMTEPTGGVWRYAYDSQGMRTSSTNPLGQVTRNTYDAAGRITGQTEPNGLATTYAYDTRGRLTAQTRGLEATNYSYHPTGQLASATLPSGYQVSYGYDAAQRLIAAQDNRGALVQYTLDAMGNRVNEVVKDALGNIALASSRIINSLNRVASLQGAVGQTTRLDYDANGQAISSTSPLSQTTRQSLDGLRRPVATTFADNTSASQAWNQLDQLTQVTDPKGVATSYQTNAFGDVTLQASPDAGATSYQRNANGELTGMVDAAGNTTAITRDALGRPLRIQYAPDHIATFSYDGNQAGYLNQIDDKSGSTAYQRDAQGRITSKLQTVNDTPSPATRGQYRVSYGRGASTGELTSITYPSGLVVAYRRSAGRVVGIDVREPGFNKPVTAFVSNLSYNPLGQPTAWRWASGDTANRSFDADGRMSANEFANYQFDAASRITGISQRLWLRKPSDAAPSQTSLSWQAAYDSRDRLVRFEREGSSTSYSYDANSNRLSASSTITSDTDRDGAIDLDDFTQTTSQATRLDATSNRLLGFTQTVTKAQPGKPSRSTITPVSYSLDANGALTSDGLRNFEYDAAQRLAKVWMPMTGQFSQPPGTTTTQTAQVSYLTNALGQRTFKTEPAAQNQNQAPNPAELGQDYVAWLKRQFAWMFNQTGSTSSLGTAYLYADADTGLGQHSLLGEYGNGATRSKGRTEYIWLPLEDGKSQPIGMLRNGKLFAIHPDHLGTPRLVTDEDNTPVWQWPYSAFGDNKPTGILKATPNPRAATTIDPILLKTTNPIELNLRMPGQYFDEESGLFYNYYRNYQPNQGRYTQADPIGLEGGLNRYAYVNGNPLSKTDPLGLFEMPSAKDVASYWGEVGGTVGDFAGNYSDMRQAWWKGADKYFHCKANCQAAQRGPTGEDTACFISDTREWWDQNVKGSPSSDSAQDQEANQYGRSQGMMNPKGSCAAMCVKYRPRGLPNKY